MNYSPYNTTDNTVRYNPYNISSATATGYNVPTYNANNVNG